MTPGALKLVADFEAAAGAAQEAEARLRKTLAEEIARAERERAFAFRRTRLVRLLAASGAEAEDEAAALAAQADAVCREMSWSPETPAHQEILQRLVPVGQAVWQCACDADQANATATNEALKAFEAWFEEARGQSFYVLFERPMPDTPVVDF